MRLVKCSVCGSPGVWTDQWHVCGSLALAENYPALQLFACSDRCKERAEQRFFQGAWKLPKLRNHEYFASLTRGPVGYPEQPSQEKIAEELNAL
jgi:hypothetical protein